MNIDFNKYREISADELGRAAEEVVLLKALSQQQQEEIQRLQEENQKLSAELEELGSGGGPNGGSEHEHIEATD